jgi:D-alanyl-D-alanine carboxypeptidase
MVARAARLAVVFLALALTLGPAPHALAKRGTAGPPTASVVIDAASGRVLYARSADQLRHPASLTKIMTLLLVFDALRDGRLKMDDKITFSPRASAAEPSKLGLRPGQTIAVRDAIYALVTKSANDVAVAVAEHLGGSEPAFARMMTARARELGMRRTVFRNASGLHDPGQVTTARDMARLAQVVIVHYPEYYPYFSTRSFSYRGATYGTHNHLMKTYPGMDGMKTGFISASGFNLAASAVQGNRRLIGVVFGGRTAQARNDTMAAILDKSFGRVGVEPNVRTAQAGGGRIALATAPPPPPPKPGGSVRLAALAGVVPPDVGQGDADADGGAARIGAGLAAVRAHRQVITAAATAPAPPAPPASRPTPAPGRWAIQVGAFTDYARAERAGATALRALPPALKTAGLATLVAPSPARGRATPLFRSRITGYPDGAAARRACAALPDCMAVAP